MSFSIDVNILLYASDQSSPKHEDAQGFMERHGSDPEIFCLSWLTIMSYLRISTHSGIFSNPLTPDQALGNIESLLKLPHVKTISEEDIRRKVC